MVGQIGRSGGHNRSVPGSSLGDGKPESPRQLSPRAGEIFDWLLARLIPADGSGPWARADGALVASVAEAIEIDERLAAMLRADPENLSLMRLKGQYTDRLSRLSALVPLSPRDRERLPTGERVMEPDDPFTSIMRRMSKG